MRQRKHSRSRKGDSRVLEHLEQRMLLSAVNVTLDATVLNIIGTTGRDTVSISKSGGTLTVVANGASTDWSAPISKIHVELGAQGDQFTMQGDITTPVEAYGGLGADTIITGAGNDTVWGGLGYDLIETNGGADLVHGGAGNDRMVTGDGVDTIYAGPGHDTINTGAGNDVVDQGTNPLGLDDVVDTNAALINVPMNVTTFKSSAFISTVSGYDPNQMRLAYDYGNYDPTAGAGQTIYIVDAFTGANVYGDLVTFCNQFDLPVPVLGRNFQIVPASGKTPAVDAGWAGETNLDVQWAHAAAPGARIVLVQADSDLGVDMLAAIQVAANLSEANGGGIVSMSFGFPVDDGIPTDVNIEEAIFKSASHTTFLASSGDSGGFRSYPSTSPEVTSVGGTYLPLNQNGQRDGEESAWIDGGGGLSSAFATPSYQVPIGLPTRGVPDVAYNADPASGVAVYLSTPQSGDRGWFSIGGTSAGSPQWAGIVARMNQARVAAGKMIIGSGLNGLLYQFYNDGNAYPDPQAPAGTLTGGFNDIIAGSAGTNPAGIGYDLATGIGSPDVSTLVHQAMQTNSFYITGNFDWSGQFSLPHDETSTGATSLPILSPQALKGSGQIAGGDLLDLTFTTTPNQFQDPSGLSASDVINASGLHRTTDGRIYGYGSAIIRNVNDVGPATVAFALQFEGQWSTGADGSIAYYIKFWAIDPTTGAAIPKSTFARSVTDPLYSGCWFGGSLSGST